jgi:hypothetical protein
MGEVNSFLKYSILIIKILLGFANEESSFIKKMPQLIAMAVVVLFFKN